MSTKNKTPRASTSTRGSAAVTSTTQAQARPTEPTVHDIFTKDSINSRAELTFATSMFQRALVAEFTRQGATRVEATKIAANFTQYSNNMIHFVAINPNIVGDALGPPVAAVRTVAGEILERVSKISPAHVSNSELVWGVFQLLAADIMRKVSKIPTATNLNALTQLACASDFKFLYYPAELLTHLRTIYTNYNDMSLPDAASREINRILPQMKLRIQANKFNDIFGVPQPIIQFVGGCVLRDIDESMFRRESRPAIDITTRRELGPIKDVIATTASAMRAVLTAALEMSMNLGHVQKTSVDGSTATAPKQTNYHIDPNSPFAKILGMAARTKVYYNSTGRKDQDRAKGKQPHKYWHSVVEEGGRLRFNNASIVLEIETRLRIEDFNNDSVVTSPKPESRKVGVPDLQYFLKYPQEIFDAQEILNSTPHINPSTFNAEANGKLRVDTVRRVSRMLPQTLVRNINNLTRMVVDIYDNTLMIMICSHYTQTISKSHLQYASMPDKFVPARTARS